MVFAFPAPFYGCSPFSVIRDISQPLFLQQQLTSLYTFLIVRDDEVIGKIVI